MKRFRPTLLALALLPSLALAQSVYDANDLDRSISACQDFNGFANALYSNQQT